MRTFSGDVYLTTDPPRATANLVVKVNGLRVVYEDTSSNVPFRRAELS